MGFDGFHSGPAGSGACSRLTTLGRAKAGLRSEVPTLRQKCADLENFKMLCKKIDLTKFKEGFSMDFDF